MGPLTADEAYERLRQGNKRFLDGTVEGAGREDARREMLAEGQQPFAIILCCADSRVVPELAFDTGLGELFVVRVAGNVANVATVASIEYAVANLGTQLVAVMAHQSCGAVAAAIAGGDATKSLRHLLGYIQPAVAGSDDADVDAVARLNAKLNAKRLVEESDLIREAVENDGVRIVTGFYIPSTGAIELV
jgi:carbonic anhydrase